MCSARKIISVVTLFSILLSTICPAAMALPAAAPLSIAQEAFALPEAKVGVAYEHQFRTEGGLSPLTWTVIQGELPPGIRLDASGKLSGAPTLAQREAFRFIVEVSDSSQPPQKFSLACSLTVKAAPLRIVTGQPSLRIITSGSNASNGSVSPGTVSTNGNNSPGVSLTANSPAVTGTTNSSAATALTPSAVAATPTPTPTPAPTPAATPTACPGGDKVVICGRLRPASMDQSLSLIRSLPSVAAALEAVQSRKDSEEKRIEAEKKNKELATAQAMTTAPANLAELQEKATAARKVADLAAAAATFAEAEAARITSQNGYTEPEVKYVVSLWDRIADSRFNDSCSDNSTVNNGDQKSAVVALLQWLLRSKANNDKKASEIKLAFENGEYTKLSDETIKKQIVLLNQYIGNVIVNLNWTEGSEKKERMATTDRDGNFKFEVTPGGDTDPITYTISTEADNNHTRAEVGVTKGSCLRVNLAIEDRPVSLLVRSVVGWQQSGAAASQTEQKVFFDFFIRKSFPMKQRIDPDFGERTQLWSAIRITSVPQPGNVTITDTAMNFKTNVGNLKVNEVAQIFDYLGGIEMRVPGFTNSSMLPSFARDTKQKFSLSFIASYGFVTPPELSQSAKIYMLNDEFKMRSELPPERFAGKEFVALVEEDRDRFYRQYYAGFRVQTFFFNRHNIPMQRFPMQFDVQWGQNEYVTGGRLHGSVIRFDGYFPLPYEKAKFISLFATAIMRPVRVRTESNPLVLKPVFIENTDVFDTTKLFDPKTLVLGVKHFNRDYYKVGVGVDLVPFFQSLLNLK